MHVRRLTLDLAPWPLFLALARKTQPFFFDAGQPWDDEWVSCMGFRPRMQLRVPARTAARVDPFAALDATLAELAPAATARAHAVPFAGGVVLALAYEAKNAIERLPQRQHEDPEAPQLVASVYDAAVVHDHRRGITTVASRTLDDAALAAFAEEVLDAVADARRAPPPAAHAAPLACNLAPAAYADRVARALAYIGAGDVYQVNLSLRFETTYAAPPLALYGRMRALQPVPFGCYLDLGPEQVLSRSPELFLRRRGGRVVTGPIKGTRPRGRTAAEDAELGRVLRTDAKERAEHVMIVDLERSDLGRVCTTGSVRVERLAAVERFATVQHLVSTVGGALPVAVSTGDLLRATFPSGSITGAPKIRAMEIIDELEQGPRGFYTGALGWIDASGDCDLNVAIRTAVARDGQVAYHAGGGIVADSDPAREHAECLLKARPFLRALGGADAAAEPPVQDVGA